MGGEKEPSRNDMSGPAGEPAASTAAFSASLQVVDILVWRCDGGEEVTARLSGVLDENEHARSQRFVSDKLASLFIQAHGGMRLLIGRCLNTDAAELRFRTGAAGKPALVMPAGLPRMGDVVVPVQFNLSHSGELAALAIASGIEVGVDIEAHRPVEGGLAHRFFDPEEARQLDGIEDEETRRAVFFALWTAKEACLKATGWGIAEGLETFAFEVSGHAPVSLKLVRTPDRAGPPDAWFVQNFEVAPGHTGTVALRADGRRVQVGRSDATAFVHGF
jgi:4'-phosphopantetheinyl transferase